MPARVAINDLHQFPASEIFAAEEGGGVFGVGEDATEIGDT